MIILKKACQMELEEVKQHKCLKPELHPEVRSQII